MLLSAAGVSCANLTVSAFDSGSQALSPAKVQAQYIDLVKEAVFMVRDQSWRSLCAAFQDHTHV
jgi:hypothetical protein